MMEFQENEEFLNKIQQLFDEMNNKITNYSKSVERLGVHTDRLILEIDKEKNNPSAVDPDEEQIIANATNSSINLLTVYAKFLKMKKRKETECSTSSDDVFDEFRTISTKNLEEISTHISQLSTFREYLSKRESIDTSTSDEISSTASDFIDDSVFIN